MKLNLFPLPLHMKSLLDFSATSPCFFLFFCKTGFFPISGTRCDRAVAKVFPRAKKSFTVSFQLKYLFGLCGEAVSIKREWYKNVRLTELELIMRVKQFFFLLKVREYKWRKALSSRLTPSPIIIKLTENKSIIFFQKVSIFISVYRGTKNNFLTLNLSDVLLTGFPRLKVF